MRIKINMTQMRHTKPNSLPLENVNSSTGVFSEHFQQNKKKKTPTKTPQTKVSYSTLEKDSEDWMAN